MNLIKVIQGEDIYTEGTIFFTKGNFIIRNMKGETELIRPIGDLMLIRELKNDELPIPTLKEQENFDIPQ